MRIRSARLCVRSAFLLGILVAGSAAETAGCPGYKATRISTSADGVLQADLTLNGPACNVFGQDIEHLQLTAQLDTRNRLHVHVQDSEHQQYQIPASVLRLDPAHPTHGGSKAEIRLSHAHDEKSGFGFRVHRGEAIVFDTVGHPLVFEDQYIEVTSHLPESANVYGLGESPNWFRRNPDNTTVTLWNRDAPDPFGENVYGSHAVYMELRDGEFHGVYLHNSHGMDIVLANRTIQYRVLGGTADFYFFGGPSALDAIDQYTELVGRPNRIPLWSLGLHNCRYGYQSVYEVDEVIRNYSRAEIPLDAAWTDIEYMDNTRDFTFDAANYPLAEMQRQLGQLHANGQKMVLIVDPAIQANHSYDTFVRGLEKDVFVKSADGNTYIGQVWPGYTVFPDWFSANVTEWWHDELRRFYTDLPIDGMWIDMNEAASFCTGSCGTNKSLDELPSYSGLFKKKPHRPLDPRNKLLAPPYAIHNPEPELSAKTIATTAVHSNGIAEYYVHNLYGHMESKITRDFLLDNRPNELYRWDSVAEASRRALRVRYALISYLYTCYQDAVERGWPVARPLVFEFPRTPHTADNDRQFLLGSSILISPVLEQGARTVDAFFPAGKWYDWYDYSPIEGSNSNVTLDAPLEHVNVHIRGGNIVPVQQPAMTTVELRSHDLHLVIATNADGSAAGRLYVDDGETFDTAHRWIDFHYEGRSLWIEQRSGAFNVERPLAKLVLLGTPGTHKVLVDGTAVECTIEATKHSSVISGLSIGLNTAHKIAFV
ncbi:hypothetical protein GGF46_005262 [Coemansia sp. RSA 552]|nr:hypothetical protein GGF46_005262 [Coemansia sp. RSA 552]